MDFLKELFESGELSFEAFKTAVEAKGYKLADLSTGNYVSKGKYEDDLKQKDATIKDLNGQISQRDSDLSDLQSRLETSGADNKTKVTDLTSQLSSLQSKYETDKADYEAKLTKQAYEFAVRDFANGKKFTSNAAKRDFINEMIAENLKVKNNIIIGADDFVKAYTEENSDAFVVDAPAGEPEGAKPPKFIEPGSNTPKPDANAFAGAFSFTGVREHK